MLHRQWVVVEVVAAENGKLVLECKLVEVVI